MKSSNETMTREEAIEIYNGLINTKIKEAFEFFAPELRESEDAMMEKAIVDALLSHCNSINLLSERGYQIEDVKAWLEKQKEQKPVEWSKEDEINRQIAIGKLEGTEVALEWDVEQRVIKWLKPLPLNFKKKNEDVAKLCFNEWRDEDEDFINMLILHFNYLIDKGGDSVVTYKSYIEKLKSLRPQSRWKPSEEQMKALQNAVALTACDKELARLYNQLKKL